MQILEDFLAGYTIYECSYKHTTGRYRAEIEEGKIMPMPETNALRNALTHVEHTIRQALRAHL